MTYNQRKVSVYLLLGNILTYILDISPQTNSMCFINRREEWDKAKCNIFSSWVYHTLKSGYQRTYGLAKEGGLFKKHIPIKALSEITFDATSLNLNLNSSFDIELSCSKKQSADYK